MMKKIDKYIEQVKEEVQDAMHYAERYVMFKNTRPQFARMYHEMAENELMHSDYLCTIGQTMIDEFAYTPEDDLDAWDAMVAHTAEQKAIVKLMLSK